MRADLSLRRLQMRIVQCTREIREGVPEPATEGDTPMTTITYGTAPATTVVIKTRPAKTLPAKTLPEKGFWARVYDAIVEARMRQVEREMRNHLYLIPENVLKSSGYRATLRDSKGLPFVK